MKQILFIFNYFVFIYYKWESQSVIFILQFKPCFTLQFLKWLFNLLVGNFLS